MPPHNLREVAAAIRLLVGEDAVEVEDLLRVIPGPDFPTGGYIVGTDGIENMYRTGRGRIVMRARIVKERLRGGKEQLVVTELPYAVSKSRIIQQIADLARRGAITTWPTCATSPTGTASAWSSSSSGGRTRARSCARSTRRRYLQTTFGAILLALDDGVAARAESR